MAQTKPLSVEIALIQKDLERGNEIFTRLDTVIERMTEVMVSMREISLLQEQRITFLENRIDAMGGAMEKRHSKLDEVKTEIKGEFDERFDKMDTKLDRLTRKIWIFTGGAIAFGYMMSNIGIFKTFFP